MHSRIIEAREDKEDICGIGETTFDECDEVREFSDYIADLEEDDDPGDWLSYPGLEWDADERTLTLADKQAYFADRYKDFRECLEKIGTATLEQFSTGGEGFDFEMYRLKSLYEDRYRVHLYGLDYYGCGLCTLDDWVRCMPNGTKIHIGNMVDYHY